MALKRIPAVAAPRLFGWLVPNENCTRLAYDVLMRAARDLGILEVPNGSNRGTRLDTMMARAGFQIPQNPKTPGVYWCAIWAGCVAADCGLLVPDAFPSTDAWLPYVKEGRDSAKPKAGDFVLYGLKKAGPVVPWGDAHHIGILARVAQPELGQRLHLTIEGNRSFSGTGSNDGVAVDIGPMMRHDILGFVAPERLMSTA